MDNRVWLEINLTSLRENFYNIQRKVKPAKIMAVLKANAYGLGIKEMAKTLVDAGIYAFGVAEINEALQLLEFKKPIQILGGILPNEIPLAIKNGLVLPITDYQTAEIINSEAKKQDKLVECHFLIDTGMGRLGILLKNAVEVISKIAILPNLRCCGIYTHFPIAYQAENKFTLKQHNSFLKLLDILKSQYNINFQKIHLANSDAINNFSLSFKPPFNLVRTGINLHGYFEQEGDRKVKLKSILTLKTRLIATRKLPKGSTLGYGCTHMLTKDTLVGTISAGYADGLPLSLSNRSYVLIKNKKCPIIGRISMDYTTVSLENVIDAKPGDIVVCLGGEGENAITVDDWATFKGTHTYDIICSFGNRVKRSYIRPKGSF
jgi:alanine racemase